MSETHTTKDSFLKMPGYSAYWTNHPSGKARGGSALFVNKKIRHFPTENVNEEYVQTTGITVKQKNKEINIFAAYCPPRYNINKENFIQMFAKLGKYFIIAGDFNAKHTNWGSQLNLPKGRELLKAINQYGCEAHSAKKPTYWPTDPEKIPDLLDFFIVKGILASNIFMENITDLSSDHTPVLMNLSGEVIRRPVKQTLTNKKTDWNLFRKTLNERINLKTRMRNIEELETVAANFIETIQEVARVSTPLSKPLPPREIQHTFEIREMLQMRRRARKIWQNTRYPPDKTRFNRISQKLTRMINEERQQNIQKYLENLSPDAEKDYSLWKATKKFKRPIVQVPPICVGDRWIRSDKEKAELFAEHLASVFQPHNIQSDMEPRAEYQQDQHFKLFSPKEIAEEIDKNINPKKSPGIDKISPGLLKELNRKAVVMLANLFNASVRLEHVPSVFKIAQIIMLKKPDKPAHEVTSYRPISLLLAISKLFEKLLLKRLQPLVEAKIPNFQFGFRSRHSTIEQVQRVTMQIERAFEEKKYCAAVFLDVSQAFDRVWHEGLIHKLSRLMPGNLCRLLESYLKNRKFQVAHEEETSEFKSIKAGVPQGSVLGPLLYLLYTADIPETDHIEMATFADDTAVMATASTQEAAVDGLQKALDRISNWTKRWKIMLNEKKSVQVTFALHRRSPHFQTYLNNVPVPQAESAKYLGMHLDARLNWKVHVKMKALQVATKLRKMYWIVGRYAPTNLRSKVTIYKAIIRPIITYGIQLWGCAKKSNVLVAQRSQNKFLRVICNAYRYTTNEQIHRDLGIQQIEEVIHEFAVQYEKRLHRHTNPLALDLLLTDQQLRRLRRTKPHELIK